MKRRMKRKKRNSRRRSSLKKKKNRRSRKNKGRMMMRTSHRGKKAGISLKRNSLKSNSLSSHKRKTHSVYLNLKSHKRISLQSRPKSGKPKTQAKTHRNHSPKPLPKLTSLIPQQNSPNQHNSTKSKISHKARRNTSNWTLTGKSCSKSCSGFRK